MPEALTWVVVVDRLPEVEVVVVLVHVVPLVDVTVGSVTVDVVPVVESSREGAGAESGDVGAAEHAASITRAATGATRGVIFMEDIWAGERRRRDGRERRPVGSMLRVRPRPVNGTTGEALPNWK